MTTEHSRATEIVGGLTAISEIDIERDLVRRDALGSELDFSPSRGLFEDLVRYCSSLATFSWERLPDTVQLNTVTHFQNLWQALEQIRAFSAANQGAVDRDNHANKLRVQLDRFKQETIPFVGFLSWDSIDLDEYQQRLNSNIQQGQETIERFAGELEATKVNAEETLATIRAAAAEAGVSQEAVTFHDAADRYESSANAWLRGAIVAALVTVGVGIGIVVAWNSLGDLTGVAAWQAVLGRAAVLVVLSYATVTAVRMYRSNAHLAAVNRHREDALRTFNAFVDGTESRDIKDKILLAAAHAAFGQTSTGLVGEKADGSNTLEVFEGLFGRSMRG